MSNDMRFVKARHKNDTEGIVIIATEHTMKDVFPKLKVSNDNKEEKMFFTNDWTIKHEIEKHTGKGSTKKCGAITTEEANNLKNMNDIISLDVEKSDDMSTFFTNSIKGSDIKLSVKPLPTPPKRPLPTPPKKPLPTPNKPLPTPNKPLPFAKKPLPTPNKPLPFAKKPLPTPNKPLPALPKEAIAGMLKNLTKRLSRWRKDKEIMKKYNSISNDQRKQEEMVEEIQALLKKVTHLKGEPTINEVNSLNSELNALLK